MIDDIKDSTKFVTNLSSEHFNWWILIATIELFVIAYLLFRNKRNLSSTKSVKEIILHKEFDGNNLFNSAFNAKPLYDKLIRECHPDRFAGDSIKSKVATELSSRIVQNKANYKALLVLQKEAQEKLNITNIPSFDN